jgi:hypothetical protein
MVLARTRYDDGGFSGGNLERPALQQLIADIQAGRIDIVVVYKVDRLTRSLADFARLVELFDAEAVSFVSVTQQFNTTSSMGRLTLNVLLSFAQFEREVTGERIRDKIAASKRGACAVEQPLRDRGFADSPVEESGFEPLVPLRSQHNRGIGPISPIASIRVPLVIPLANSISISVASGPAIRILLPPARRATCEPCPSTNVFALVPVIDRAASRRRCEREAAQKSGRVGEVLDAQAGLAGPDRPERCASCLAAIRCRMGRESLVDSWAPLAGGPFVPTPWSSWSCSSWCCR